jgi:hypothetical protein
MLTGNDVGTQLPIQTVSENYTQSASKKWNIKDKFLISCNELSYRVYNKK